MLGKNVHTLYIQKLEVSHQVVISQMYMKIVISGNTINKIVHIQQLELLELSIQDVNSAMLEIQLKIVLLSLSMTY